MIGDGARRGGADEGDVGVGEPIECQQYDRGFTVGEARQPEIAAQRIAQDEELRFGVRELRQLQRARGSD